MAIISTRLQEDVIKAADILGSISAAFSGPRAFGGVGGGVSAGSFPETAAGNRAYWYFCHLI